MKLQFADDDARKITLIVFVISGLLYGASAAMFASIFLFP